MRIVQLSDIHLSKENLEDLKKYYLQALINDLKRFHSDKLIDVILFTGDLVDKGGESLGIESYQVFKDEIIIPIIKALNLTTNQILLLLGNHDVNRHEIDEYTEAGLCSTLDSFKANDILLKTKGEFIPVNKRMEKFKSFESEFHKNNLNYVYSNNESTNISARIGTPARTTPISRGCANGQPPNRYHLFCTHQSLLFQGL